jgi:NAD(P)-dependent dehydrogenase (short-subunit alcohol dehydrogenase family)
VETKVVVITGSTRGLGYGLAASFLTLGCSVVVSSRSQPAVDRAVKNLMDGNPAASLLGIACDVTRYDQVRALWDASAAHFGHIDIWINNAGISNFMIDFPQLENSEIQDVVDTNILGALYGSQIALRGFKAQGSGSLYNVEGLGSDGRRKVRGLALYGTTKAALHYFNEALIAEVAGGPVLVGAIQPGMVATEMITRQYEAKPPGEWQRARRFLSLLTERVETVTPWIAKKVLENRKNGAHITWLTGPRFFAHLMMEPFYKRNVFD